MSCTAVRCTTIITFTFAIAVAGLASAEAAEQHGRLSACVAPAAGARPVDLGALPPIDSVGAQTSVAAFMQDGVPTHLQLAALRRAWSMDPAIRDFRGLSENDWDFDVADAILGFGELDPDFDIDSMVADIISEPPRRVAQTSEPPLYQSLVLFLASWLGPAQGAVRD